jgi:hypothetical protein
MYLTSEISAFAAQQQCPADQYLPCDSNVQLISIHHAAAVQADQFTM